MLVSDTPIADHLESVAQALGITVSEAEARVFVVEAFDVPLPWALLDEAVSAGLMPQDWTSVAAYVETASGYPVSTIAARGVDILAELEGTLLLVADRAESDEAKSAYPTSFGDEVEQLRKDLAKHVVILGFTEPASVFVTSESDRLAQPSLYGFDISLDPQAGPVKPTDAVYDTAEIARFLAVWNERLGR